MWQARRATILRLITVMLAAISWLALSNHCALGLAMVANHGTEEVSTHDCCTSTTPSQPEPTKKSAAPCCKTLQIVSVAPTEAPPWKPIGLPGASIDPLGTILELPGFPVSSHLFLDTGPPKAGTFAETVLQRSLLSHAPPSLS